ncbi:sulfur carrier protein ThiS [Paenibacillus eucommiae]|uniref:Sulfur carrier protein n=1 Tax=Paenibacillus eucommiae TaxID=1355755 RepID=A0ABS4IX72_9BACL|nr:sulfur carrier protein ThiS [Paenibacillus eucommiae]MBP1992178.1 sulfur carrier protein [Paenibacillus eucommiae]
MELVINGERKELEVSTLQDVIDHYGLQGKPIVAEVGGVVLVNSQWAKCPVLPGMRIELVHFVGGG